MSISACSDKSVSSKSLSVNGTWSSSDPAMVATVSDNQIVIDFVMQNRRSLYWKGTLPSAIRRGVSVISVADKQALAEALLGSEHATKTFKLVDNKLQFDLSIMGTTTTVKLSK
jgi:hypothetical protein